MGEMPANEFVELRGSGEWTGYYLAGSRISLDTVAYCLRRGETPEQIMENFPALEGEERLLQGAIDYIHAHQAAVDAYLERQAQRYEELRRQNPLPPALAEKFRKYRAERGLKSA